jgi:hypothetical protein
VRRARFRAAATASVVGVATVLSYGCVVTDGGYGYGGAAYGLGYYEPAGIPYGGWGPAYEVAPFRRGDHYPERYGGGRPPPHAYRAAPASRAMPSIPTGARPGGGGGHGGGGHGGGGAGHH